MKILFVEDQKDHADQIAIMLKNEFPDAQIQLAYTEDQGKKALNKQHFDVLIVDLLLEGDFTLDVTKSDDINKFGGIKLIQLANSLYPNIFSIIVTSSDLMTLERLKEISSKLKVFDILNKNLTSGGKDYEYSDMLIFRINVAKRLLEKK